jgi:hypothetical protein
VHGANWEPICSDGLYHTDRGSAAAYPLAHARPLGEKRQDRAAPSYEIDLESGPVASGLRVAVI